MKTTFFVAALSLSAFAFGCSSAPGTDSDTSAADLSTGTNDVADAAHGLSGTFESVGTNPLKLAYATYTFHSNGTYSAVGGCTSDTDGGAAACHAIIVANGKYTLKAATKTVQQPEITLVDSLGNKDVFLYSNSGNTLTFNRTVQGDTQFFFKSDWTKKIPMGDVCQDNSGKSLGECSDSGNFGCGLDGISDNVYTCTPLD